MVLVRRTVLFDKSKLDQVPEGVLNELCRTVLDEYTAPEHATVRHSALCEHLENKVKVLQEQIALIDTRRPLLLSALQRTQRVLDNELATFEYKQQTVTLKRFMQPLTEFIIATDFDEQRTSIECAHIVSEIKKINPDFQLGPWIAAMKRELD